VTERAALAGARWLGRADKEAAEEASFTAARTALEQRIDELSRAGKEAAELAEQARAAAAEAGAVIVFKGPDTVVAAPDGRVAIAPFENPALASGGTGDVLSGTIGSLLAQHVGPFDAARLGVYLHGLAGDTVRERLGDSGLLASDLPDPIALARKRLAQVAERRNADRRLGFGLRPATDTGTGSPAPAAPAEEPAPADRRDGDASPSTALAPRRSPSGRGRRT